MLGNEVLAVGDLSMTSSPGLPKKGSSPVFTKAPPWHVASKARGKLRRRPGSIMRFNKKVRCQGFASARALEFLPCDPDRTGPQPQGPFEGMDPRRIWSAAGAPRCTR